MKKFTIEVVREIVVTLDESKFTPEFVEEFNSTIGYMGDRDDVPSMLREHAINIAQQAARGVWDEDFAEGYGPPSAMGIKVKDDDAILQIDIVQEE